MRNSRLKMAVGLLLPLGAFAGVALAQSTTTSFTFTVTPNTAGSVADTTGHSDTGTYIPASSTVHLPPGALVAYADDASSPVSPPPMNGDLVGQVKTYGDLWNDGCGNYVTTTSTITWVEPIGTGAPAGAVAEMRMQGTPLPGLTITKRAFFVKSSGDIYQSGAHYDLVVPDMPDEFACTGSSTLSDMTTYGYAKTTSGTATTRIVGRNPSIAGTYNVYSEYKDTNGVLHVDAATYTVK